MRIWDVVKKGAKYTAIVVGLAAANSSLYTINQTEHAVITRFGRPVKVVVNPVFKDQKVVDTLKQEYTARGVNYSEKIGFNIKVPFIDKVNKIDRRLMSWDGYPQKITSLDKRYIWEDVTARWYVEDPLKFYEKVETIQNGNARLDDVVDSYTGKVIPQHNLIECVRNSNAPLYVEEEALREAIPQDSINFGREAIMQQITEKAKESCRGWGIGIKDVKLKRVNYVEEVKIKVEERMIAERKRIAEQYRSEGRGEAKDISGRKALDLSKIMSNAYAEAERIRGQGDGKATKIYGDEYSKDPDFFQFWRSIDVLSQGLDSSKANIVLGTDNELFRYLKTPTPNKK